MSDYMDLFTEEAGENIDSLQDGLMQLENQSGNDALDTIRDLFRFAHNLKGMAATISQDGITGLAHRMEDLLDLFRNEVAAPTSADIDLLLEGTDRIASMLAEVPSGAVPEAPPELLASLSERAGVIQAGSEDATAGDESPAGESDDDSRAQPATSFGPVRPGATRFQIKMADTVQLPGARAAVILGLADAAGKGMTVLPSRDEVLSGSASMFAIDTEIEDGEALAARISALSDVADVTTTLAEPTPASVAGATTFSLTMGENAVLPGARAAVVIRMLEGAGSVVSIHPSREDVLAGQAREFQITAQIEDVEAMKEKLEALSDIAAVTVGSPGGENTGTTSSGQAALTRQTVRVEVERLDDLMNMVGELVIGRGQLEQHARRISDRGLVDVVAGLSRTISDLQAAIARARMITLEATFSRLKRLVRDTSKDLGKAINFSMEGGETELDRSMIDKVADPLVHLLRNAVDHGVEDAESREKTGKNAKGSIRLSAATEGNQVVISVEDDGAGIDTERVAAKAISKGIVTADQVAAMSESDKLNLIFLPGFSTREQASAVSGRGVGMDVVRTSVNELGGSVDVTSVVGQGSSFRIRLPLSLAVLDVLLVKIADQTWAIPLQHVEETINVEEGDLGGVLGSPVVTIRGETVGVIHGNRVIGHTQPPSLPFQAVVFRHRSERWALSVDTLLEQAEVVVKPSPDELAGVDHVAGATILGDGRVSMILDLGAVVQGLTREELRHAS